MFNSAPPPEASRWGHGGLEATSAPPGHEGGFGDTALLDCPPLSVGSEASSGSRLRLSADDELARRTRAPADGGGEGSPSRQARPPPVEPYQTVAFPYYRMNTPSASQAASSAPISAAAALANFDFAPTIGQGRVNLPAFGALRGSTKRRMDERPSSVSSLERDAKRLVRDLEALVVNSPSSSLASSSAPGQPAHRSPPAHRPRIFPGNLAALPRAPLARTPYADSDDDSVSSRVDSPELIVDSEGYQDDEFYAVSARRSRTFSDPGADSESTVGNYNVPGSPQQNSFNLPRRLSANSLKTLRGKSPKRIAQLRREGNPFAMAISVASVRFRERRLSKESNGSTTRAHSPLGASMMELDLPNGASGEESKAAAKRKLLFRQISLTDMGGYAAGCESDDRDGDVSDLKSVSPPPPSALPSSQSFPRVFSVLPRAVDDASALSAADAIEREDVALE